MLFLLGFYDKYETFLFLFAVNNFTTDKFKFKTALLYKISEHGAYA